jgi:gas vesicle protein
MPRVHHVTARADIYARGLRTPANNKQGYKLDKSKPADENDYVIVKKGQKYFHWQRYKSAKQYSLTRPKPSQLTGSPFLQTVYGISERLAELEPESLEQLSETAEEIKTELEELRDTTQEAYDNLPENFQYGEQGAMLEERIANVEQMIDDLEGLEFESELDEESIKDEWVNTETEGLAYQDGKIVVVASSGDAVQDGEAVGEAEMELTQHWQEQVDEEIREKHEELTSIEYQGE